MTIFKKSLLGLSAAVLSFSLLFAISVMVFMNSLYYEINTTGLRNTARTLMRSIGNDLLIEIFSANNVEETNMQIFLPLTAYEAHRLTLIAVSGYVLWDSHVTDRLVNHIDREEVIAALEGREGASRRKSASTNMRRIYYALPVFDLYNNPIGVFRLSVSIPGFGVRISPIFIPFIVFICLFLTTAFYAIFVFSRSLSVSLKRLVNIAQSSAVLLSEPEANEFAELNFSSLEKTLRAMTDELNLRFEQARAERNRLEAILNGMSEAVFAVDKNFKLLLVNPTARKLFNLGNRNFNTGGCNVSLLEATCSAELAEIAEKAICGGIPLEAELALHSGEVLHTGVVQHFLVYASPLGENTGGVILVLQDITRLVKLERVRKDFVANVSHELRTPIQLIIGFSETLLDTVAETAMNEKKQIKHFLEIIQKSAYAMENLTNDLLILADLENNANNSRDREEVKIVSLLNEAVVFVEPQAKKKQIEIIIKCDEGLTAKLYGSLIIQALINLMDNGIKYSKTKSKLWVSAFITDTNPENPELVFEVRDKGIGISSEHLERIFERFYRADRSNSVCAGNLPDNNGQKSIGLGLSIVRHIALLHKGNAEAESRSGEGAIFRIRIPHPD